LIRVTVPSPLLATHTDPAPNATAVGERPTGIVCVTDSVPGSILTSLSSSESTTHTAPSPTVMPLGPSPTGMGFTKPVAGSTRTTLSASVSVSHTALSPTAIPIGVALGSQRCATAPVVALRRVSSPPVGATQTESRSAAIALASGATSPIRLVGPALS
jgi:hypothetical protein